MTVVIKQEDGTLFYPFGKPVSPDEQIQTMEKENAEIYFNLLEKDMKIEQMEKDQANLLFQLIEKGVL